MRIPSICTLNSYAVSWFCLDFGRVFLFVLEWDVVFVDGLFV